MSFISSLFRTKKDLTKEVKKRNMEKRSETTLGFQDEEGPCTSYQQKEDLVLHRALKKRAMPFSIEDKIYGSPYPLILLSKRKIKIQYSN